MMNRKNKFIIGCTITLVWMLLLNESVLAVAGNWGLGFPSEGKKPVGNESAQYLKEYDAYFLGETEEKIIYLTFDAGYENGYTEQILDTLKENGVPATFFLVGNYFKEQPEMVQRMVADGHIIGNHTMNHPDMSAITDKEKFTDQIQQVEALYKEITGSEMKKYYRPPQGKYSEANLKLAQKLGYKTIFWSLAYQDYDNNNQPTKEEAFSKLLPRMHPGAILLLHNTSKSNAEILSDLIHEYREMGYEFKSLDHLTEQEFETDVLEVFADTVLTFNRQPAYVPVLMYHQLSEKKNRLGEYVISPEEFESDLKMLQEGGYTTITVSDLVRYAQSGIDLPEKPIMLTFDDGYQSDYIYALPLLQQYGMKAVFSIVGDYADQYSQEDVIKHIHYAHLSWEEIKIMNESGHAEFLSHSNNLHDSNKRRGALKKENESEEIYQQMLQEDILALNKKFEEHLGYMPIAFTCPYGGYNEELRDLLKESGYSAVLTSQQKINVFTGEPDELYRINRIVRSHDTNVDDLINNWEQAIEVMKSETAASESEMH